ncbi:MAG TPA: hypothetical protein VJ739_07675 [Gemmataceae bacterium]|nr:hypothetical protein [Gemmataceae bacterium]
MNFITADDELRNRLGGIVEPIEIRDTDGRVLGVYTPVLTPEEQAFYARVHELFDMDEIDRIEREERGQGRPLAELWERLRESEGAP